MEGRLTVADVVVEKLTKRYGSLSAVDGISFSVEKGEIFGVLGPNGAGKTTTLEMLEGLRRPDGGAVTVLGFDMLTQAARVKQRIGVQLQATALPPFTSVREAIDLFGALYDHARPTDELLEEFDLREKARAKTNGLSGGQQQRLSIALALVNDPDLVFLDEPTTGLDPQARLNLWEAIEGVRRRGKTVILTTHYMEEAERLADRIAVMDHGSIVALDTPTRLIATHAPGSRIEFDPIAGAGAETLARLGAVDEVTVAERVRLSTRQPEVVLRQLLDPAAPWSAAGGIRDLMVRQGTLEEVFIKVTGRKLRE